MTEYDPQPGRMNACQPELSAVQIRSDEVDLRVGLSGIADIVAGARTVDQILQKIAELAVLAIPGAHGAGVTVIRTHDGARARPAWAVTADFVRDTDMVQYHEFAEGPCITCMRSRRAAVSGSLGSDSRWPRFGGRVARMGVHSVLALPLVVGDELVGAIDSYARGRDAFADHAVKLGMQFAGPAAVSVYNAQLLAGARERTTQLQHALETRAVIDQAIGILRSRSGVSADDAFERLKRMSQEENVKLHLVAEALVEEAARRARARYPQP
jgi:GAF domain-containing protein